VPAVKSASGWERVSLHLIVCAGCLELGVLFQVLDDASDDVEGAALVSERNNLLRSASV